MAIDRPLLLAVAVLSVAWLTPSIASAANQVTCVGDSITYGAGTDDPSTQAYPVQLGALLGAGSTVENDGHSGATLMNAGDLPYTQQPEYTQSTATVQAKGGDVVIMLGTNDTKPQNWTDANKLTFEGDCEALVEHYLSASDAGLPTRVWVNLPSPDWPVSGTNEYGIDGTILKGQVIPLLQQCAAKKGVSTIDVWTALSNDQADFSDGVHPNAHGAGLIAQTVHDALVKQPTITISAAPSFPQGQPVVVDATPTAAYGTVQSVEIFEGVTSLGKVTSAPWTVSIHGLSVGTHALTGRVTETAGRTADSTPAIHVQVMAAPVDDAGGSSSSSSSSSSGTAYPNDIDTGEPDAGAPAAAVKSDGGCNVARGEGFAMLGFVVAVLAWLQRRLRPSR